ncbi:hypothetical protein AB0A98_13615, partial [Streptomyces chrestomyceticus]
MIPRRTLLIASTGITTPAAASAPASPRPGARKADAEALHLAPARVQVAALCRREISSRDLLEQYLRHIAQANPHVNAIVTLDADAARAAADRADRHLAETGRPLGDVGVELLAGRERTV